MPAPVAARLRERVAFERRDLVDDGHGNKVGDWREVFRTAARIKPMRGAETVQASRLAGEGPVVITVRSSDATRAVTTDLRARDVRKGTIFNIRSIVNPDERNQFLDLECMSGVAT
jgi:SPP1 family predicted phage head-tail adaptor